MREAGVDVNHYVRSGKAKLYKHGVDLDVLDMRKGHLANNKTHYDLRCVEEVWSRDGYELVIVPMNANQLNEALSALIPCIEGDTIFLTFTSNLEGPVEIDALLPRERYLMGYPDGGGTIPDRVYWTKL